MFTYIHNYHNFMRRIGSLRFWDYEERDLELCPDFGSMFEADELTKVLQLARLYPEYHIISAVQADLFVNFYVEGAAGFLLGEGDADPKLVFDSYGVFDEHFLHSWYSGRNRRRE